MFKRTLAALATLSIFTVSTAFAGGSGKGKECDPDKVAGSYVRIAPGSGFMDQIKLGRDGTAYWYWSGAFQLFITQGTFIPHIGSWKCVGDGKVLVTTIGTNYAPNTVGGVHDITIFNNVRFTEKLSVVDNNTLQPTHRLFRYFALADDPLGPNGVLGPSCTPSGPICGQFPYKRVKPLTSDIP